MKHTIALLMALCLCLGLLAGCGGTSAAPETSASSAPEAVSIFMLPPSCHTKIGISL